MRKIAKKALGAMLIMSNKDMVVEATTLEIAHQMGYKSTGGAITFALDSLESDNRIIKLGNNKWQVTI